MKQELFVTCPKGLEELLLQELNNLGIEARLGVSGIYVPRKMEWVYRINYCSRLATRVLWPMASFRCPHKDALYREIRRIDWTELFTDEKTFSIDANVIHPNLKNSLFAALVAKDAICDFLRDKFGNRPSIDTAHPDIQLNLYIYNGIATISFDTSGPPLYKRGWREETGEAPLQESLAAAVLTLSQYAREESLCDPFCGSGTILVEAAMMATNTPPGYFREKWGFVHHPRFSLQEWTSFKETINQQRIPLAEGKLFGADKDPESIAMCKRHLEKLGCASVVDLQRRGIASYSPFPTPSLIVTNPPYGKRLYTSTEYFKALGQIAAKTRTCILAPNPSFMKATGRSIQKSFPLISGGLKLSLFHI